MIYRKNRPLLIDIFPCLRLALVRNRRFRRNGRNCQGGAPPHLEHRCRGNGGGPAVVTTGTAEFQVRPDGYVQASLLERWQEALAPTSPGVGAPPDSDFVRPAGTDVHFTLDLQQAKVTEAMGKMGAGKRIEIPARPLRALRTTDARTLTRSVWTISRISC